MNQPAGEPRDDARQDNPIMDHEYDGIQEYDNPMPRWWLASFWGTVIFSVLYLLNVPVFGMGRGRIADYQADSAQAATAAAALAASNDPLAGMTDERLTAMARDTGTAGLGRSTFGTYCAACHEADGGGNIGPNLTDAFTVHGGQPTQILHTINVGVPEKGMPPWGQSLRPDQLTAVAAYVVTLRGTTPKKAKEPQGVADSATGR